MTVMTAKPQDKGPNEDGRRARSRSSHQRIVKAMMSLIAAGDLMPSAARVAEEANIGLRTVFRHFDDMDAIYSEISAVISAKVLPIAVAPFAATDWLGKLRELAQRRVTVFEMMLPFRLAANVRRHSSPLLLVQYGQVIQLEREFLLRQLPDHVRADRISTEALCAALSFQNWRALRYDQQLTPQEAEPIIMHMVDSLVAAFPAQNI